MCAQRQQGKSMCQDIIVYDMARYVGLKMFCCQLWSASVYQLVLSMSVVLVQRAVQSDSTVCSQSGLKLFFPVTVPLIYSGCSCTHGRVCNHRPWSRPSQFTPYIFALLLSPNLHCTFTISKRSWILVSSKGCARNTRNPAQSCVFRFCGIGGGGITPWARSWTGTHAANSPSPLKKKCFLVQVASLL